MAREDRSARDTTTEPGTSEPDGAQPVAPGARPDAGEPPRAEDQPAGPLEPARPDDAGPGDDAPPVAPGVPARGPGSAGHALERTRLGGTWVAISCFALVLLFLLFFILMNGNSVSVSLFGDHSRVPLGVALVLAAVCGALLVVFAGMARIMQMRTRVRRHRRAQRRVAKDAAKARAAQEKAAQDAREKAAQG